MKINRQSPLGKTQTQTQTQSVAAKATKQAGLRVIPANSDSVEAQGGRTQLANTNVKPEPMVLEISTTFGEALMQLADAVKK